MVDLTAVIYFNILHFDYFRDLLSNQHNLQTKTFQNKNSVIQLDVKHCSNTMNIVEVILRMWLLQQRSSLVNVCVSLIW